MASLYHSSLPFSPPSSSCHGVLSFPPRTAASFACLCRVPPQDDHDAELLGALQSNGNGILLREQHPAASAQPLDPIPGELGDGRRRSSQFRARDCARRIMSLPMEERVKVLDLLQRDDAALTVSDYNDIISALARGGDYDSAVALFRSLEPNGSVAPDAHSFAIAVQCFCRKGAPDEAKETLDEMVARGYLPSVAAFSAVVGCLCKRGRVTRAMEVFDAMRAVGSEPTIRTYNSLIGGLCYVGRLEEARDLLNKLKDSPKQTADIYTFTIVLEGFCKVGRTEDAMAIFEDAIRMGLSPTIFTYNALLNGHCKEGNLLKAYDLLMEMCDSETCPPDKISYTIVLPPLLRAGEISAAWKTFKRMEHAGFEADGRTLDTLARGLCRQCAADISVLKDAKEVFGKVVSAGHEPVSYTYCLMAQALARGGEVDAAVAILDDMVRKGYALRKRAYTDVVRALCDRSRTRDAVRVLATVIAKDFVPGRNAFDALLGELSRQERWPDAMAVYAAALKRGVVVSLKRNVKEALVVDHEEEAAWESPAQLGVPHPFPSGALSSPPSPILDHSHRRLLPPVAVCSATPLPATTPSPAPPAPPLPRQPASFLLVSPHSSLRRTNQNPTRRKGIPFSAKGANLLALAAALRPSSAFPLRKARGAAPPSRGNRSRRLEEGRAVLDHLTVVWSPASPQAKRRTSSGPLQSPMSLPSPAFLLQLQRPHRSGYSSISLKETRMRRERLEKSRLLILQGVFLPAEALSYWFTIWWNLKLKWWTF